ncbi:MAG: aldo/keto reductase [Kiritimatiellaeota bacterium]|nr:aldo/keto reductase [Kiritimatiellota bacterium]
MDAYAPSAARYDRPRDWFRRCGQSGLQLPALSLGCWHNFGAAGTDAAGHGHEAEMHANARCLLCTAFDLGITHFDLANNYGPPPGAAEERVGRILRDDFRNHRDELIISSKAGYRMGPGPYGDGGSRKHLLASLDQSLRRLGLDYVDIFYSHRPDPLTPVAETLGALDQAVRSGKALYAGLSNYSGPQTAEVLGLSATLGLVRPVIHQPRYSLLHRAVEADLLHVLEKHQLGIIAFCPLAQGLLSDKYLAGIPDDSRAASATGFLRPAQITPDLVEQLRALNALAAARGQSLAQMALAWVLRDGRVTSALIGASRPEQIRENVLAVAHTAFTAEELARLDAILAS